ncbi:mPR-like GPCR protein [Pseudomassariella vexata]|uniref:MPR-like GPCR protein n=1 Tax=Pseudomassariella vexata TaxID=1141098 RepID=A0A1Y2DHJ6_9PEZI|nr:mPR-like GPCR protein [Pseudomassariella vexata]ORY58713.1 mPR-like GPCR protein [Pseudomassariella vexata]
MSSKQPREASTQRQDIDEPTYKGRSRLPKLLLYHAIPQWQQENEYILSGYRPTSGSVWISLESLLYINNETISTYSHLLGCALFLCLPLYFYRNAYKPHPNSQIADMLVVSTYCLGVAVCFALSATCHIVWNHSPSFASLGNKLDYLGILVLMWGASIPTIYYGFFCDSSLRHLYWTTTSLLGLGCAVFTLNPRFSQPRFRRWRACLYASFGLSSIIFVVHGLILHGWEVQSSRMSLVCMSWMACSNTIGAVIYAARVPERWVPYRFDIYGASHQIFHVAVMVAALIHYAGLWAAFDTVRSRFDACTNS